MRKHGKKNQYQSKLWLLREILDVVFLCRYAVVESLAYIKGLFLETNRNDWEGKN